MNEKQLETRTRVLYDQTAKDGWRVKEICIELTNHDNPVRATRDLFHRLREQAEQDAEQANADNRPHITGNHR